jgi:hypothetical protein
VVDCFGFACEIQAAYNNAILDMVGNFQLCGEDFGMKGSELAAIDPQCLPR